MTEKLKKKPRMTCKQYCPVWNDIDKDCELYGEHHLTPRTCPHYNIEILEKKITEKFIEENYDTQNTKKEHCKKLFENTQELQRQIDEVLK